jgi:hypothetical protein
MSDTNHSPPGAESGGPTYKPTDKLTRKQAADYLGISLSLLARHRRNEEIGFERNEVTRDIRFPFSEVEKLKAFREGTVTRVVGRC